MRVIHTDSAEYLSQFTESQRPDVIYMDPMYPTREKTALVKKEMRLLHELVGPDTDSAKLLEISCRVTRKRVVVKRPKSAAFVADQKPAAIIESKNTRYDIYF